MRGVREKDAVTDIWTSCCRIWAGLGWAVSLMSLLRTALSLSRTSFLSFFCHTYLFFYLSLYSLSIINSCTCQLAASPLGFFCSISYLSSCSLSIIA
ncbi:hypothetical protein B0T21DRAFT_373792 [Apiosordaria backusii]|uniref:Uncharacterized protein n=1 Tax=Apiosordaria backusii TaxID=314023 RepID=A0AA40AT88_9PEZI|nr:hypothetical protein B0T21DRAFT_373792 [Apiosordaria backusii]